MKRASTPLALLLLGALALGWLATASSLPHEAFEPWSALNYGPEGCSQAKAYLEDRSARAVGLLTRPMEIAPVAADAVLLRLAPDQPEGVIWNSAAEEQWVQGGGRLVLALTGPADALRPSEDRGGPRPTLPCWPAVKEIDPPQRRVFAKPLPPEAVTLYAHEDGPTIARRRLGRGEVVWLSCGEVFQNAQLARADHLALLSALVGKRRPVLFDETARGADGDLGSIELLAGWGLGPTLSLGALAALLLFWRARARLGPPDAERLAARSLTVDFVDSLALLYQRRLPRPRLIELYREALGRTMQRQERLSGPALAERLRSLVHVRARGPGAFGRQLAAINRGFRRLKDARHRRQPS